MTGVGAAAMAATGLITSALAPALLLLSRGHALWQRISLPAPAAAVGFVLLHSAITIAMSVRVPLVFMAVARPALLVGALLFWLPVLGPPGVRLDGPGTSAYLFLAGPTLDFAAVYLIARGDAPGGLAMIVAMLPIGLAAVYLTWRWIAAEERDIRAGRADTRQPSVIADRGGTVIPGGSSQRWPVLTTSGLRACLGLLWLIAACLQAQPWMFTTGFASKVLAPAAGAQPSLLGDGIRMAAAVTAEHPALANVAFVVLQAALGLAMLWPRTARPALIIAAAWAVVVWVVGEGLGGLLTPMSSVLTGSPGAALLYAVLAVAALPPASSSRSPRGEDAVPPWLPTAWTVLWLVMLLSGPWPGMPGSLLRQQLTPVPGSLPGGLADSARAVAGFAGRHPLPVIGVVVAAEVVAALGPALARNARKYAFVAGVGLAVLGWIAGQSIGGIATGHATDVGTGPLLVLLAVAAWSARTLSGRDARRKGQAVQASRAGRRTWRRQAVPPPASPSHSASGLSSPLAAGEFGPLGQGKLPLMWIQTPPKELRRLDA